MKRIKTYDIYINELKSFTKRDQRAGLKGDWVIWNNGDLVVNPTDKDRLTSGFRNAIIFQVEPDKKQLRVTPYDDWADTKIVLRVQKGLHDMIRAKYIDDTWNCVIMNDKLTKRSLGSKKVKDIINADYSFADVIPYAYHGTSDYFLDDIKRKGLQPRNQSGEDEIWDKGYTNRSEEMVYMTIDYNRANYYADYTVAALKERGIDSKPIVVLVKNLPTTNVVMDDDLITNMGMLQLLAFLDSGKSKEDFANKASYITGIRQSGQLAIKGRIPATMITKIYKEKPTEI